MTDTRTPAPAVTTGTGDLENRANGEGIVARITLGPTVARFLDFLDPRVNGPAVSTEELAAELRRIADEVLTQGDRVDCAHFRFGARDLEVVEVDEAVFWLRTDGHPGGLRLLVDPRPGTAEQVASWIVGLALRNARKMRREWAEVAE